MGDRPYRLLTIVAVALTAAFVGYAAYEKFVLETAPGDMPYHAGNRAFEGGNYERAIEHYSQALAQNPDHVHALRGLATGLHQAGRHEEALAIYDDAITRTATRPEDEAARTALAANYANRGILLDTIGRHEEALADYTRALEIDAEVAEGPHWLTRFLRKQAETPPTIADRARYLRAELTKPEDQRVLRIPGLDAQQRPYKQ